MLKMFRRGSARQFTLSAFLAMTIAPAAIFANEPAADDDNEDFAMHGQVTGSFQWHPAFHADYSGLDSLDSKSQRNETTDATLYVGYRPWDGAEFWVEPEIDQGFGLSNTLGVAGFTSGEAYKVGKHRPYFRLPRAFFRQEIDLDGAAADGVEAGLSQLAGHQSANHVVLWGGKFAVTDVFDTNRYAGDARNQFLNWALVNQGAFDYAADAWGFTYGGAAEWYQDRWAMRAGVFNLSKVPNSTAIDPKPFDQYQTVAELEERHSIVDQPGKLKITWYASVGRMGSYIGAIAAGIASDSPPSTSTDRAMHTKQGIGLNGEQQIADGLGAFFRLGWSQGKYEAFEFTDINKSGSAGLSLSGSHWGRDDDTIGVAIALNGVSEAAKRYFAAGGLGILVGDGQLQNAAAEQIWESYYNVGVTSYATVTFDYQLVNHPAYNVDRGPVNVFAVRGHMQF